MAHITLVRPPLLVSKNTLQGPITPPIGLAYLASNLIASGHVVTVVDAVGEAPDKVSPLFNDTMLGSGLLIHEIMDKIPRNTDLIGVSGMFSGEWPYVRQMIKAIKKATPSIPVIGGGEHFTAVPEFIMETCPEIEYCVLGEGEETLVELADRFATPEKLVNVAGLAIRNNGKVIRTPPRDRIRQIDEISPPAWDLVPIENYLIRELGFGVNRGRSMPLLATRGCPYTCVFCSSPFMWGTRWLARKPELVLDEIEFYLNEYDATNIDFYDLTAIIKREWIKAFCQLILERGLKFTWQLPSGTRSEAIDEEVSGLLYASGCRNLSYAPESGSPRTLRRIKKKVKLERMLASMQGAVHNNLNIKANIIVGFPGETRREILETIWFLVKMAWVGVHDITISMYSPYPGAELFVEMKKRGKLTEFSDEYFFSLNSYSDVTMTTSWSDNVTSRELAFLRILSLAIFYGTQYSIRPWRVIRTLYNLFSKRQESRLEKSLHDYTRRILKKVVSAT